MIHIYTTISQHPKGFDLHIRNLSWAFSNFDHKIFVQTFKKYNLPKSNTVEIVAHDANPKDFFRFYDTIQIHPSDDVSVFVQQDNLFTQQVDEIITKCRKGTVFTWDQGEYYAIHTLDHKKIFPRVAEISTFLPSQMMKEFESLELSFGCFGKQFYPGGHLFKKHKQLLDSHTIKIQSYLSPPEGYEVITKLCEREVHDTMYEPTLFCFCEQKKVELLPHRLMVHFQNPERFHREEPATYSSVDELLKVQNRHLVNLRIYIPAVAFMFFLSDVYDQSPSLKRAFLMGDNSFWEDVKALSSHAATWMSKEQHSRLKSVIRTTLL